MTQESFLHDLARSCGFCCLYALIRAYRRYSKHAIANRLGVTPQTVAKWRARVRDSACRCERTKPCIERALGEIPTLDLSRLREGVRDPFVD